MATFVTSLFAGTLMVLVQSDSWALDIGTTVLMLMMTRKILAAPRMIQVLSRIVCCPVLGWVTTWEHWVLLAFCASSVLYYSHRYHLHPIHIFAERGAERGAKIHIWDRAGYKYSGGQIN